MEIIDHFTAYTLAKSKNGNSEVNCCAVNVVDWWMQATGKSPLWCLWRRLTENPKPNEIEKEGNTNTNWNKSITKNLKLKWQKSQNKSQPNKRNQNSTVAEWRGCSVLTHKTRKNKTNFNHNSSIKTNISTIYAIHLERKHQRWWRQRQRHQRQTEQKQQKYWPNRLKWIYERIGSRNNNSSRNIFPSKYAFD